MIAAGLAGAIVDRFENRALLIVVSFAQAAVVAGMVAGADELWALLPLMALLGFGVAVSQPAEFALVPAVAGGGDVGRANGRMETARSLGFTAGPLVGGALGAAGLLRLALAINALSFVVVGVTALVLRARRRRADRGRAPGPGDRRRRAVAGPLDGADGVRVRRRRARGQERPAAHADPRARARGAARPRVRRLQRRAQRRRARRPGARRPRRRRVRRPQRPARRRR